MKNVIALELGTVDGGATYHAPGDEFLVRQDAVCEWFKPAGQCTAEEIAAAKATTPAHANYGHALHNLH